MTTKSGMLGVPPIAEQVFRKAMPDIPTGIRWRLLGSRISPLVARCPVCGESSLKTGRCGVRGGLLFGYCIACKTPVWGFTEVARD